MTHICVNKLTVMGSGNGLSPGRRQAIIWTSAGKVFIGPFGTNFSQILSGIQTFSFKKMHFNMSSAKWRSFCLGLNVLKSSAKWQPLCLGLDVSNTVLIIPRSTWITQGNETWSNIHLISCSLKRESCHGGDFFLNSIVGALMITKASRWW